MLGKLLGLFMPDFILKALDGLVGRFLDYRLNMAKTEAERDKTRADQNKANTVVAGNITIAAMGFKLFWIPWLIAAVPASAWYGWGMLDSLANGSLPDVAALPPQLKELTEKIFDSLFTSGAIMGGVQLLTNAMKGK
jgi:hypothetical protein